LALVTLVVFGLMQINDSLGFKLQRRAEDEIERITKRSEDATNNIDVKLDIRRQKGELQQALTVTWWYRTARRLHFLALLFAFITMLAELRAPRPCPRIDLLY
jgi:hypothetical protein